MTSVGLVVARYNEDLSWINEAQAQNAELNVYIYNKHPSPIEHVVGPYHYEYRPNVGNEAETYLYHIIRTYGWSDDVLLFVQGRPYDHVYKEQLYSIIRDPEQVHDFTWLAYHKLNCNIEDECHHHALPIAPFYRDLMGRDIRSGFEFGVGGQFAVTYAAIVDTDINRYKRARDLVLGEYRTNEPWCILERTWDKVILEPDYVE